MYKSHLRYCLRLGHKILGVMVIAGHTNFLIERKNIEQTSGQRYGAIRVSQIHFNKSTHGLLYELIMSNKSSC